MFHFCTICFVPLQNGNFYSISRDHNQPIKLEFNNEVSHNYNTYHRSEKTKHLSYKMC